MNRNQYSRSKRRTKSGRSIYVGVFVPLLCIYFFFIDLGSHQTHLSNSTEQATLKYCLSRHPSPFTMGSNAIQGNDNSLGWNAVWESENPFGEQAQNSRTPSIRSSGSLIRPALTSDCRRPSPPELSSETASVAVEDPRSTDYVAPERFTSRLNPTGRQAQSTFGSRQQRAPHGAVAASRSHAFNDRQGPFSSYMKQSCLPVSERDPDLFYAEQNKGRVLAKEVFKPGMIIRAALHDPLLAGTADSNDKRRTSSLYGPVFSKIRKLIVVALYEDHYVALPVYTHHGNGLQAKAKPDEYISVSDHRSQEPVTQLSKHLPLVTETMNSGVDLLHPKATIHLTYPVSRKYDLRITPEGNLNLKSVRKLITLYNDSMPRAPQV